MAGPDVAPAGASLDALVNAPQVDLGLARPAVAGLCLAGVGAVLLLGRWIQQAEATASLQLARLTGVSDAERVGTAVVFQLDGRWIGYSITLGCTVAFLLVPFLLAAGLVITVQRASVARALVALTAAVAVVALCNQVRLLMILTGIRALGLERGYSATHVLLGTAVSTVGVVTAALLFLAVITAPTRRARAGELRG